VAVYNHYKRVNMGSTSDEVELQKSNVCLATTILAGQDNCRRPVDGATDGRGRLRATLWVLATGLPPVWWTLS
jgi:hypothetical protein